MKKCFNFLFPVLLLAFTMCKPEKITEEPAFEYIPDPADRSENSDIPRSELKNSIRMMTFNINAHFTDADENMDQPYAKVWQRRRDATVQMLRDKQPDVCFLEELIANQAAFLQTEVGDIYSFYNVQQKEGAFYYLGVLYKKERIQLKNLTPKWFSYNPDVPFQGFDPMNTSEVKCAALCEFRDKKTNNLFYAIGAHFVPSGDEREICASLAASWAEGLAGKDKPVLVMGDLNIHPDDAMLKPLYDVMKDAVDNAKYSDGRDNFTYNRYGSTPFKNLDHIFYRNLNCVTYRVVNSDRDYAVQYMSDHYPVFADIVLN